MILRALAMLGGMVAILLVPHPPEHQPYLGTLAWGFVAYKVGLFAAIWAWPTRLRPVLLASVCLDLAFVSLFVWFGGGLTSHFYLLFYLLIALVAAQYQPGIGLATAAAAGVLYLLATMGQVTHGDWHHLVARAATFFLLAGSLAYLSQRERLMRSRAEALNRELQVNQERLESAYGELKATQHRLVQSERLATIGQMSAKVSHEVRNPLSSISLNIELLEDELVGLPEDRRVEVARLVRAIRSQVDVLSSVTEEYLHFARLPKPAVRPTAVDAVIADLADFVREELRARRVDLVPDIAQDVPSLSLDPNQIRQAVLNLIRNAADAMPDGGTVGIGVHLLEGGQDGAQDGVEITVRDTGPGVPPEDREKIFEPFVSRTEGGTGLGLAIARQVALDHGGMLACENGPGGGAVFRLRLPAAAMEKRP